MRRCAFEKKDVTNTMFADNLFKKSNGKDNTFYGKERSKKNTDKASPVLDSIDEKMRALIIHWLF